MGHKGVSKRKKPQIKLKSLATANRGAGAISGLAQSESLKGQVPAKTGTMPAATGRGSPSSGSKKKHKTR